MSRRGGNSWRGSSRSIQGGGGYRRSTMQRIVQTATDMIGCTVVLLRRGSFASTCFNLAVFSLLSCLLFRHSSSPISPHLLVPSLLSPPLLPTPFPVAFLTLSSRIASPPPTTSPHPLAPPLSSCFLLSSLPVSPLLASHQVDARNMWETYMPAFEACIVEAKVRARACVGVRTCSNWSVQCTCL